MSGTGAARRAGSRSAGSKEVRLAPRTAACPYADTLGRPGRVNVSRRAPPGALRDAPDGLALCPFRPPFEGRSNPGPEEGGRGLCFLHLLPSALQTRSSRGSRVHEPGTVESRSDGWGFTWPQVESFGWPRSAVTDDAETNTAPTTTRNLEFRTSRGLRPGRRVAVSRAIGTGQWKEGARFWRTRARAAGDGRRLGRARR
jgi:hypothetical protein